MYLLINGNIYKSQSSTYLKKIKKMLGNSKDFLIGIINTTLNNGNKDITIKIYNKSRDFSHTTIEMKGNTIVNLHTLVYPMNQITEQLIKLYELREAYELIGKSDPISHERIKKLEDEFGEGIEKIIVEAVRNDYPFECYNNHRVEGPFEYALKPKHIISICDRLAREEKIEGKNDEIEAKLDKVFSF